MQVEGTWSEAGKMFVCSSPPQAEGTQSGAGKMSVGGGLPSRGTLNN